MLQWPWGRFTSGSSDFVMVVNRLKMRRDQDVLENKKTQEYVERVSKIIWSNRRVPIREISEDLNISYGSVQNIFNDRFEHESEWMRNLFHVFWRSSKSNSVCHFHWSFAIVPLQIPAFWEMSSLEMKLGSMVMILRPRFGFLNGNHPILLVPKKTRQSSWVKRQLDVLSSKNP